MKFATLPPFIVFLSDSHAVSNESGDWDGMMLTAHSSFFFFVFFLFFFVQLLTSIKHEIKFIYYAGMAIFIHINLKQEAFILNGILCLCQHF